MSDDTKDFPQSPMDTSGTNASERRRAALAHARKKLAEKRAAQREAGVPENRSAKGRYVVDQIDPSAARGPSAAPAAPRAPARKRVTFNGGAGRYRLHSPELEEHFRKLGFHIAWLNDQDDDILRAESGGYQKVQRKELPDRFPIGDHDVGSGDTSLDSAVSRHVGTDKFGRARRAFLMKIPQEWFEEDDKVRQQPVDEIERQLRRGRFVNGPRAGQQVEHAYGDISITTGSD